LKSFKSVVWACRVDILLAIPWNETRGGREVVARINEMDWVNSAAVMANLWDNSQAAQEAALNLCSEIASANASSSACDSGIASATMQDTMMAAGMMRTDAVINITTTDVGNTAESMQSDNCGLKSDGTNVTDSTIDESQRQGVASTWSSKPCAVASVEQLKQAMQQAQGSSSAFVLAEAMLRRAIATMQ
jgi:hypothetical protein